MKDKSTNISKISLASLVSNFNPSGGFFYAFCQQLRNMTTLVIRPDGSLWGWGDNSSGQLGIQANPNDNVILAPVKLMDYVEYAVSMEGATFVVTKSRELLHFGVNGKSIIAEDVLYWAPAGHILYFTPESGLSNWAFLHLVVKSDGSLWEIYHDAAINDKMILSPGEVRRNH